jgi:hypothetical protein
MKKEHVLAVLFFSGLWGFSEAILGDALYRADVRYASVPLTVIGLCVLSFAWANLPQAGTATLIAACAMLYKFLNTPFFACHLLGILLMGICFDLLFGALKMKNRSLAALLTAYLSYGSFALMITYAFRYEFWRQAGITKVLTHVGIDGSMAAAACAVLVPLSFRLAERLKASLASEMGLSGRFAAGSISAATIGLWAFGVAAFFLSYV